MVDLHVVCVGYVREGTSSASVQRLGSFETETRSS